VALVIGGLLLGGDVFDTMPQSAVYQAISGTPTVWWTL
jgi:hypothetical protein